ncbi:MAG: AraC family transcriptional regulator [Bacteroidota bacterium]
MKPILESIELRDKKSILAFHYSKKRFETPWHFHPQHELTYIESSYGTKFIGDYVGNFEPGELVLLRSNLPHCWKNHVEEKENAQSYVVQWNKGIFTKIPELSGVFAMLKTAARGMVFSKEDTQYLVASIKQLPQLPREELYIQLLTILIQLTKCSYETLSENRFLDDFPMEHSSRISKIHDFVEANYQRKIYLKDLSNLVNMSEPSFSRFFSKTMGRPFFVFLNEYRINMASRMLIDTDKSVAEIGFACGYESLPFFHKQFNRFKGESPSKYRKRFSYGKL